MATQAGAIRYGTPIRTSPIPIINARAAYLPQLYSLKESERARQESLDEEKRQFGLSYGLAEEQQAEAERQAKRAGQLGLGNLALSVGMGVERLNTADATSNALATLFNSEPGSTVAKDAVSMLTDTQGSPIVPSSFSIADAGSSVLNTFSTAAPWAGGAAGAVLGPKVGSILPFGGETEKGIIGGALAGGAVGYAVGGDIYSAITGALLGGVGGGW